MYVISGAVQVPHSQPLTLVLFCSTHICPWLKLINIQIWTTAENMCMKLSIDIYHQFNPYFMMIFVPLKPRYTPDFPIKTQLL